MLLELACNSFQGHESHFVLSSFVQQHKTQLLAKFKKFGKWGTEQLDFFFKLSLYTVKTWILCNINVREV